MSLVDTLHALCRGAAEQTSGMVLRWPSAAVVSLQPSTVCCQEQHVSHMSGSLPGPADTGSFDLGLPNTEMGKVRLELQLEQAAAAAVLQCTRAGC